MVPTLFPHTELSRVLAPEMALPEGVEPSNLPSQGKRRKSLGGNKIRMRAALRLQRPFESIPYPGFWG